MIGPTEHFQDLIDPDHNGRTLALRSNLALPTEAHIAEVVAAEMNRHGLIHRPEEMTGIEMLFVNKDRKVFAVGHHCLYSRAEPGEVLDAVRAHIQAIAANGPGCVWFLAEPVHLITEGNAVAMIGDNVMLRTFYGHEKQGVAR